MSYSDNGVDEVLSNLFGEFIGHAADIGANDGWCGSNTLEFEKKGWTVLCVEPNPYLAVHGRARRRLWRQVACSNKDEEDREFGIYAGHASWASHSSLSPFGRYGDDKPAETFKVPTRTLDRLLEEAGFPKLDFVVVDVEGWEPEVIEGLNVEKWKPKVIVVEDYVTRNMEIHGYKFLEQRGYDKIHVREEP